MNRIMLSVELTTDKSQIVIRATTQTGDDTEDRSYFLEPAIAVEVGNALLHGAEDCGLELKVQTMGISDTKRMRLILRCTHVMRSLSGKKTPFVSAQIVDTILAEVL